jgi:3-hydroxybutyryl-CoA dehydrogenase
VSEAPRTLGVVGAGTMGSGIAQLGVLAGTETLLHDPFPEALERGGEVVHRSLAKGVERERWSEDEATAAEARLQLVGSVEELSGCDLVVEAAPERLDLKRELFERLSEVCSEDAVLATNTSSILVTSIASAAARPENVVGMHFFNPPPLMRLLEVIAATQTGERALAVARAAGEAMGKRVIVARDGPGFLVNRCGRPFYTEALRLLQERVATHEQIDRICRMGGGFRMGPFELMDMVGIDVGYEVARSFTEQSFGEPRWRPNPIQARMVAAGRLGRKAGRGYYDYGDGPHRPEDPEPSEPGGGEGRTVVVQGEDPVARELRERAAMAGFDARRMHEIEGRPELIVNASVEQPSPWASDREWPEDVPLTTGCFDATLGSRYSPRACGFHLLPPLDSSRLVELTRLPSTPDATARAAERFFGALGFHCEWVGDAPGLVLGRIVCQLVNEAAFAVGEGVGSAADVDAGLELGLNHPRGPLAWGKAIGLGHVFLAIQGLGAHFQEDRYRPAPALQRAFHTGTGIE